MSRARSIEFAAKVVGTIELGASAIEAKRMTGLAAAARS